MIKLGSWPGRRDEPAASGRFIFIVGFNKTGTRSLHGMFQSAGFASIHNGIKRDKLATAMVRNLLDGRKVFHRFDDRFRVFSDMSYTDDFIDIQGQTLFPAMDRDYPGSLFIFNRRPLDKWVRSRMTHHLDKANPLIEHYKKLFRTDDPDLIARLWIAEHDEHERRLRSYFAGSPDYIEIDIETDDVPARLSDFVGHPFAAGDWVHLGKTGDRAAPA